MYLDGSVKRCIKIYTTTNTVVDPFNHLIDVDNIFFFFWSETLITSKRDIFVQITQVPKEEEEEEDRAKNIESRISIQVADISQFRHSHKFLTYICHYLSYVSQEQIELVITISIRI